MSTFGRRRLDARLDLGREAPGALFLGELDPRERLLALDDAERAVPALLLDEVVERTGLLHVLGHVRRDGHRADLAVTRQAHRELRLLDGRDVALGLRDQLLLAQPA